MTTRPCDTLALSGSGWCGTERVDVLALNGGEIARLGALDADHRTGHVVDALLARPDRRRHAAAVPDPVGQARRMGLHAAGEVLDADLALEIADRLAAQALQQPQHPVLRKVLQLMGFRIQRGLVVVIEHRRANRHTRIDPAARQDVDGGQILGQPQRILQAERDHRRAQFDAAGALGGGSHDRDRGGDARLQVPTPQPDAVEAERFGALDHRQRLLVPGSRIGLVESADGQEPELAQRLSPRSLGHAVRPRRSAAPRRQAPAPARRSRRRRSSA